MSLKIAVLTSTNRPSRRGSQIAKWLMRQLPSIEDVEYDLIDIAEENLPLLDEEKSPKANDYQLAHTKRWSKKIAGYDGYIWLTAEYNHGYPAPLKNALDMLYYEWNKKPVGFVGYGGMGGTRSIEQLINVASELQMMPVGYNTVRIIDTHGALDDNGEVKEGHLRGSVDEMVNELIWWAQVLQSARQPEPVAV